MLLIITNRNIIYLPKPFCNDDYQLLLSKIQMLCKWVRGGSVGSGLIFTKCLRVGNQVPKNSKIQNVEELWMCPKWLVVARRQCSDNEMCVKFLKLNYTEFIERYHLDEKMY